MIKFINLNKKFNNFFKELKYLNKMNSKPYFLKRFDSHIPKTLEKL